VPTLPTRSCVAVLLVLVGWPAVSAERLAMSVRPKWGLAPTDVIVQALIEPDPDNKRVSFTLDSSDFYQSSTVELNGDRAPRTSEVRFRMLPAGSYEVRVTLTRSDGEHHATGMLELW
jgi:hypothetical protein